MAGIDVAMKHSISAFPQDWSEWLGIPIGTPVKIADCDVSTVATIADRVIEVGGKSPFVLHVEPQSYFDRSLDVRMFESNGRLTKRHQCFVHTTVLLLNRSAWGKANRGRYREKSPLSRCHIDFQYDVVKVWELPVKQVLAAGVGVLPIAPLTNASKHELPSIIDQMSARFRTELPRPIEAELWTATFALLGLRYDKKTAHTLLRGVRDIMRESTTYQAIIEEGKLEGRVEGRVEDILRLSTKRFGKPSRKVRDTILSIRDVSRLDAIFDRILDAKDWNELLGKTLQNR